EPSVNVGHAYLGSLSGRAIDPNPADTITFSKSSGPGWLSIAASGALSGMPTSANVGTNSFTVMAIDSGGLFSSATMSINVNGAPMFSANPFAEPGINVGQNYFASVTN